jgi:hypothetical protein
MKPTTYMQRALRDAKIIEALCVARHALAIHDRAIVMREGDRVEMDFTYEIRKIDEALHLLKIDTPAEERGPEPVEGRRRVVKKSAKTSKEGRVR